MTVFDNLGSALRRLRDARGLSQKEVAKTAGVTAPMLSSYENGRTTPEIATLDKVLDGIGASLADLEWALHQVNQRQLGGERPTTGQRPAWRAAVTASTEELTGGSGLASALPRALEEGYSEIVHGLLQINRFVFESVARSSRMPFTGSTPTGAPSDEGTTHRE